MRDLVRNRFYRAVKQHVDNMLDYGRGQVDGEPCPLFAGVVDVAKRQPVTFQTPPPPGIRVSDFNWCGNNLMHDLPLMEVMQRLTELGEGPRYAEAVEDIFAFYGKHCPHPDTGLFPWGEHAQWSFEDKAILPANFSAGLKHWEVDGYLVHDHLAFAPGWFWEGMWRHHPEAVTRFAHGLDRHIVDSATFEHNRHGGMSLNWWHDPSKPATGTGKDFARHAGFFIFDCLFAYARSRDERLLDWSRKKLEWHLKRRLPSGIVSGTARSREENLEGQHDSLALSVAEAAELLGESSAGREFSGYAEELLEARVASPTSRGLPDCPADGRLWVTGYFRKPHAVVTPSNVDLLMLHRTRQESYAAGILAQAEWVQTRLKAPEKGVPVMARRFWEFLELMLNAHAVSGEARYLEFAETIADWAINELQREGFFLGCSRLKWTFVGSNVETHWDPWAEGNHPGLYYSITSTSNLGRAMLRLAMVQSGKGDLGPDPYRR